MFAFCRRGLFRLLFDPVGVVWVLGLFTPSCIASLFAGGYRCLTPAVFFEAVKDAEEWGWEGGLTSGFLRCGRNDRGSGDGECLKSLKGVKSLKRDGSPHARG